MGIIVYVYCIYKIIICVLGIDYWNTFGCARECVGMNVHKDT